MHMSRESILNIVLAVYGAVLAGLVALQIMQIQRTDSVISDLATFGADLREYNVRLKSVEDAVARIDRKIDNLQLAIESVSEQIRADVVPQRLPRIVLQGQGSITTKLIRSVQDILGLRLMMKSGASSKAYPFETSSWQDIQAAVRMGARVSGTECTAPDNCFPVDVIDVFPPSTWGNSIPLELFPETPN